MGAETDPRVVERWRYLRDMLVSQLAMFEAGTLTLRANNIDIAPAAIADLRDSIQAFDAMIVGR